MNAIIVNVLFGYVKLGVTFILTKKLSMSVAASKLFLLSDSVSLIFCGLYTDCIDCNCLAGSFEVCMPGTGGWSCIIFT